MRVHKFEGATMRDAIAKVKAELGDQAVIIATRQVRRGLLGQAVEISAAIDDEVPRASTRTNGPRPNDANPGPGPSTGSSELVGLRARAALVNSNDNDSPPQPPPPREPDLGKLIDPLRSELRSLRALVRSASDHRGSAELRTEVAALRKLVEGFAGQPPFSQDRGEPGRATAMVAPSKASVIVLVGPTGAGKTTTIAKLAARAALVDGVSVRLITLDSFRIGGVDQIRTYAELIGVPVDVAERPEDLAALLAARRRVRPTLTLIDTAGRSPRDHAAIAELARALHPIARHHPEVHLVAPAATSLDALARLADRYRALGATRLLVTKLDEHDTHPELVQMPGRVGLPITWVTTGQAVPEDLEQPDDARLHELAAPRNTRGAA